MHGGQPSLLITLFDRTRNPDGTSGFEYYLADRGIQLDGVNHDHDWVGALHRVLVAVDPEMPGKLQQALLDIADLASAQGHEMALELVGERQLVMFGPGSELCVEDLAFQMYLEHAELFTASHARVKSQEARRFVDFFSDERIELTDYDSDATRVQLIHQLRRWFADRNHSEYIELRLSETDDEVTFLVIHGCTPRNVSVITSPFSRDRLSFVPDRQDTIVLSKREGRLSVNAQYPTEQDFYRQLFGRVYFGRQNFFESCEVLTGDVLLDDPEAALSVTGLPGLSKVTLRELTLEAHDHPHDTLHWKAYDLRPVLPRELPEVLRRPRKVRQLKLALYFGTSKAAHVVEIIPPNKLTYDRRTGEDMVRQYLSARGFFRQPQGVTLQQAG